jgi:hypothetical protein
MLANLHPSCGCYLLENSEALAQTSPAKKMNHDSMRFCFEQCGYDFVIAKE